MKKFSMIVAAAAVAVSTAAPLAAEPAAVDSDPFVATQGLSAVPALGIVAGVAAIVVIAASSSGT